LDVGGSANFSSNVYLPSKSLVQTIFYAGAASPNTTFLSWGDGSGWKFALQGNSSRTSNVLTAVDSGNVGISCNAPAYILDVNGFMKSTGYSVGSTNTDVINGAPSYGMGVANFNILGYTGSALPLQIAHYYGVEITAGATGWAAGAPTCVFGNKQVGINCNAPGSGYALDVNGLIHATNGIVYTVQQF